VTGTNDAPTISTLTAGATEAGTAVSVNALQGAADADDNTSLSVVVPTSLPAGVSYARSDTQLLD
jgi:hypothetical protein